MLKPIWLGDRELNGEIIYTPAIAPVVISTKNTTTTDLIKTFESLLIAVTEPSRNKRSEELPGARLVLQAGAERPRPAASYLEELRGGVVGIATQLEQVKKQIDQLAADSDA